MSFFPGYQRRLDLLLKQGLTTEERQELVDLDKALKAFVFQHSDFVPGGPARASIGDILKAKKK